MLLVCAAALSATLISPTAMADKERLDSAVAFVVQSLNESGGWQEADISEKCIIRHIKGHQSSDASGFNAVSFVNLANIDPGKIEVSGTTVILSTTNLKPLIRTHNAFYDSYGRSVPGSNEESYKSRIDFEFRDEKIVGRAITALKFAAIQCGGKEGW